MLRFYSVFAFLFFFSIQKNAACGYSFLGDCSTSISLSINGTVDSFAVAPCPGVLKFDNFVLGNLQSLGIVRAKAATWESCQNNVSGVELWYRVHEQGLPGGTWHNLDLQEDYNTLVGPYTTRYRSKNTNISLTSGLTVGKIYVLEIYFRAEIDTIGDDFIPETTLLQNNNGQNFHLTFQYGGAAAPPFVVTTTKVVNVKCHGDSTGVAGVSVYGNQSGLFYQWSTGGNNFWILSQIPAGAYSVTVTGVGGYAASDTIDIAQPAAPLSAQLTVAGLGCNGSPGQATAVPTGGTSPYHYNWTNGEQTATATFADSGIHALTMTDANGCSAIYPVDIPTQPVVQMALSAKICQGGMYTAGGMDFVAQGFYEINLPGANGHCDTLIQLTLDVLPLPVVEMEFKTVAPYACSASAPTHLIITAVTNAQTPVFEWLFDGQVISTADTCYFVVPGLDMGLPTIPVLRVTDEFGCYIQTGGNNITITQPPLLKIEPTSVNPVGNLENGMIYLNLSGGVPNYAVLWDNGSTNNPLTDIGPGIYCATISDARGCTDSLCITLSTTDAVRETIENSLKIAPNPAVAGQWVTATFPEKFAGQEVLLEILDLQGRTLMRQMVQLDHTVVRVLLPEKLAAGTAIIRSINTKGLNIIGRIAVR